MANCSQETKDAMTAFKEAEANIETVRASELEKAKGVEAQAQAALNDINAQIDSLKAQEIEKEFAVYSTKNPEQLYDLMGIEELGLSKEVFLKSMEGYNNLDDKGNGTFAIVDTSKGVENAVMYSFDFNTFEVRGVTQVKLGSRTGGDVLDANVSGSNMTSYGFMKFGGVHNSSKRWRVGTVIEGLEPGINDNMKSRYCVAHYTEYNTTAGCIGVTPVYTNGTLDQKASIEKMQRFTPAGGIVHVVSVDPDYYDYSSLYPNG